MRKYSAIAIGIMFCLFVLVMVTKAAASSKETAGPDAVLNTLLSEALAGNPGLQAIESKIAALRQEIPAAGTWEDPRIGFSLLAVPMDTYRLDQEPMTQKQITLSQSIPWFGKLDLKTRQAALNVVRMEWDLTAKRQDLILGLRDAYYELGFVAVSQEINERMITYLDQIARFAETRYSAGKGLQQDVLQAQVEQSRLMDERYMLQRQRRALEDRINGLLGRGTRQVVMPPTLKTLPQIAVTTEQWQQYSLENNPDLNGLKIAIELAAVDIETARKGYYPDPNVTLAYGQRDEAPDGRDRADFISASVSFTLPVWAKNKQERRLAAAVQRRDAARSQYRDLAVRLPHRVDALATELSQLKDSYRLYKDAILIQADQWAEAARFSYEVGKADFSTMLAARLRLLTLERQSQKYLFQFYQKLAALAEILGGGRPVTLQNNLSTLGH